MRPDERFRNMDKPFWANVRTISEMNGYSHRGQIKIYTVETMMGAMSKAELGTSHIYDKGAKVPTPLGKDLLDYFEYRADVLNTYVESRLMDASRASSLFYDLKDRMRPGAPLPMNKQKSEKRAPAFLNRDRKYANRRDSWWSPL